MFCYTLVQGSKGVCACTHACFLVFLGKLECSWIDLIASAFSCWLVIKPSHCCCFWVHKHFSDTLLHQQILRFVRNSKAISMLFFAVGILGLLHHVCLLCCKVFLFYLNLPRVLAPSCVTA